MIIRNVLIFALAAASLGAQGFSGPQVLSRGGGVGERAGHPPGFSVFGGVLGSYETGLTPASINSEGNIVETNALVGVIANIGAYGRKDWRRASFGIDYQGNYRHYAENTYFNGSDQALALAASTQLARRLQLFTQTTAGTISRYYAGGPVYMSEAAGVASYGVFDNRANYLQNSTGFQFSPNARWAFSASGNAWTVQRQSKSLVGVNGYGGEGTMSYRLSRYKSLQGSYTYNHFDYTGSFGETDVYTAMGSYAQRLGRRWQLSIGLGVSRVSTIGLEQVAADPLTAALFGQATSIQAFSRLITIGAVQGSLTGNFRTSKVEFTYSQMPNAGNGVFLTSKQTNGRAVYSYTGIRRASLSLAFSRLQLASLGQSQLGQFAFTSVGAAVSYKLIRNLEAMSQFDSRNIGIDRAGFSRLSYRFTVGLNWHPSEFPITWW